MKAELVLAMLHNPSILFLDEPTIGLDVLAKRSVRDFLNECNDEFKNTIVLTSHDMKDLDIVVDRIIMLDQGKLFFDGSIEVFKESFARKKSMAVYFANSIETIDVNASCFEILEKKENEMVISFEKDVAISEILTKLEEISSIQYFEVKPIDIEDIVREIYKNSREM